MDASTQTHWSWLEDARRLGLSPRLPERGPRGGEETSGQAAGSGEREAGLPPLPGPAARRAKTERRQGEADERASGGAALHLPEIVHQLQVVNFAGHSSSEGDSEGDSEEDPAPFPDVKADVLPSPAILRYLRESQSMASEFFSLGKDSPGSSGCLTEGGSEESVCNFCGQGIASMGMVEVR